MNKVPKIVCVSVLVCSNATLPDDAGPQSNKSYRSWFWQRQFLRSGHWLDRSEFTLCPRCVNSCTVRRKSVGHHFHLRHSTNTVAANYGSGYALKVMREHMEWVW